MFQQPHFLKFVVIRSVYISNHHQQQQNKKAVVCVLDDIILYF